MLRASCWILLLLIIAFAPTSCRKREVRIGSKKFTESVVLGELVAQLTQTANQPALHFRTLKSFLLLLDDSRGR